MTSPSPSYEELQARVTIAEQALLAIHRGEVDALVIQTDEGERLFTLGDADAFYHVLVDEMPLGVAGLDPGGTILYANPQLARMLKAPPERILGARITQFLPPQDADAPGIPAEWTELVRATGERFPVDVSIAEVADGQTASICLIVTDISERVTAAALGARLAAIVESSDDAIMSLTPGGVIETWNDGAVNLYGYSGEDAIDRHAPTLLRSDPVLQAEALSGAARHGEPTHTETRDTRKDGSQVEVFVTDSAIRDADGHVIGIARIARDITELKRVEEVLREAEARANAARDEALEASRMKSAFLANMSHEIRTPLNGVIGMSDLLLDSPLNGEQRDNARLLKTASQTLDAVVNDILDYSKIEAGALRIERVDFDLIDTVEHVCRLIGDRAYERGLELTMQFDHDLPDMVSGDAVRVRQVITNLISNAVKFTTAGEIRVSLRLTSSSQDVVGVRLDVVDTGIGIEHDRLEHMFEPFVQADDSTTRRFGGTGLGLAIVKQLVEAMGGEVGVDSTMGEGSRFWFALPLGRAELATGDADCPSLVGVRLLAIGVSDCDARVIAQAGMQWRMLVTAVPDGREALAAMRAAANASAPFDCLVVDVCTAGLDCVHLAQDMSGATGPPSVAVVALAGSGDERLRARDAAIDVHMAKPVRRAPLQEALLEALAIRTRRDAPADEQGMLAGAGSPLILIAEDNELNQILAVRMLAKRGYRSQIAVDGHAALQALQDGSYAAVLMDCQMPEVNGYDATRELRRRERGETQTPVIAMTANALQGDREKCLDSGMDDYVPKPVTPKELDRVLRRWAPMPVTGPTVAPPLALEPEALEQLRSEFGPEGFGELVELFASQTPALVADLRASLQAGDAEAVGRGAHKLKGTGSAVAAASMALLCQALETQARGGSLDGASELVDQIDAAREATHAALLATALTPTPQ
jgi:two-component system sensor histidine kinase/response regulator